MTTPVRTWLDFALLQSAAESYLNNIGLVVKGVWSKGLVKVKGVSFEFLFEDRSCPVARALN